MGRPGRYTLAVMAWVVAYAGWSTLVGLVIAALTGDRAHEVSPGASALLTVIGPLVPTVVALWFNDWARDGFPTKAERQRTAPLEPVFVAPPDPPPVIEDAAPPSTYTKHPVAPLIRD